MRLLKLIPVKTLVKNLPQILAYIFTKVLCFVVEKYPHKTEKVKETASEISVAVADLVKATEDGNLDKKEVKKQIELWKEVFN